MVLASIISFNALAKGSSFAFERFVPQSNAAIAQSHNLPQGEMLFRPPNGENAEDFFARVRNNPHMIIPTDLHIMRKALKEHDQHADRASINLNVETISCDSFLYHIGSIQHDPSKICLEVTEQGGVPENFTHKKLEKLREMGYGLSLDDVDLRDQKEWDRLGHMGPFVDTIKFPHQLAQIFREGSEAEVETLSTYIRTAKALYPNALQIMEGVRETDAHLAPAFHAAGIDIFQESSFVDKKQPKLSPLSRRMIEAEFALAI